VQLQSTHSSEEIHISLHYVLPATDATTADPIAFFCFPGGSLNRHYFDLDPEGPHGLSFAEFMAKRGHVCVLVDHPGIGASGRPADGCALDSLTVASLDSAVVNTVLARLATGLRGHHPLADIHPVAVGHSMGGALTGLMQAHHALFEAVAILGWHPFGALDILMEPLWQFAENPDATRINLADTLRSLGADPFKDMIANPGPTTLFEEGDCLGKAAIATNCTELLTVCRMFSMIPGSWRREAAMIEVPVLLCYGDDDLCKRPHDVPSCFSLSPDVTLLVLRDTGHNHFAFATRRRLFNRINHWARGAVGTSEAPS
ncbi:MAG: alpha/beta fold hydrolase, partial [Alphaproteobacteria bacterium]|nr:alpha/beta fold hydrolase [Alphaproteobacteria bacterium]